MRRNPQMVRYEIDHGHTHVGFTAKHLGVSTVHGQFSKFEAGFEGPDEDITKASGTASGQLNRMDFGLNWDGVAGAVPFASHTIKLNLDAEIVVKAAETAAA